MLQCKVNQKLTPTEQLAVDYINMHTDSMANMTITDIANNAFVSPSTVSRAIRKCGYSNLISLRYKINSSENLQHNQMLVNEILAKSYDECSRTIENIQIDSILRVAEYIRSAGRIFVVACGITSLVAQEFEFQLQCQRYNVWSISDSEMLKRMNQLVHEDDLVVIFSVANSTPELTIAAKDSKARNAKVVVCCCEDQTTLTEYADEYILGCGMPITPNYTYGSISRIGLQIIARIIIEYLVV